MNARNRPGRWTAFALGAVALSGEAVAGPTEATVRAGVATIAAGGNTTTVTQTSDRAVIDWRSFDIGAAESVIFQQPGAQSAMLNRVTGGQFTSLQGTLTANGQIYLVNPNGILIGSGARVDAAAFVASTANVSTENFMASPAAANGRYVFNELTPAASGATIVNQGTITVADGGLVALVAPAVRNAGTITARLGTIELASARYFTLDLFGDDLVRIAADDSIATSLTDMLGNAVTAQVEVGGELRADGGRVVLLAVPAAANVVNNAINLGGIARAHTVAAGERGEILLLANDGAITIGGALDASAPDANTVGGRITAIGDTVRVTAAGSANASGVGGGGLIVLGGVYTAGDPTNTRETLVDAGATVRACGTIACSIFGDGGEGNGGVIRLYSTDLTRLAGDLDVTSGFSQEAGMVEVLSSDGPVELAATARILARTGVGQPAGFAVVIGDTLNLNGRAEFQMLNFDGEAADSRERVIAAFPGGENGEGAGECFIPGRCYVVDPTLDAVNPERETSSPIVFHAYGDPSYIDTLPDVFPADPDSWIFAASREPPVGTLRPNGGAPTTLASGSADALAPIPITLTPPAPPVTTPPPTSPPPGDDGASVDTPDVAGLVRETVLQTDKEDAARDDQADGTALVLTGGPGVARTADLGRSGGVSGASPDVFGVNHHVLAPSGEDGDAPVADYLCKTPYATNGCRADAAPE